MFFNPRHNRHVRIVQLTLTLDLNMDFPIDVNPFDAVDTVLMDFTSWVSS